MSKKKKIVIIVLSVLLALIVLVVGAGVYALNMYCKTADYNVVSAEDIVKDDTYIIAHRGFRGVAPENTAPAFDEAGKAGFWGAECDVYRTADGVWVIQHDFNIYRMMNGNKRVDKATYDELMQYNTDNGVNIDKYPELKICTLKEYLDICKQYDMKAVIELKGKDDSQYFGEIVDMVNEVGVEAIYISFDFNDMVEMRKLTDADLYYLVQEITDEDIELAKSVENCGIDFNGNKEENFEDDADIIKECKQAGLSLGAWTIDDRDTMQRLLDLGVNYITTDCITY